MVYVSAETKVIYQLVCHLKIIPICNIALTSHVPGLLVRLGADCDAPENLREVLQQLSQCNAVELISIAGMSNLS